MTTETKIREAFDAWWKVNGIEKATFAEKCAALNGYKAAMASLEHEVFYLCEGCGHYYQVPVSSCDCMAEIPLKHVTFYRIKEQP